MVSICSSHIQLKHWNEVWVPTIQIPTAELFSSGPFVLSGEESTQFSFKSPLLDGINYSPVITAEI